MIHIFMIHVLQHEQYFPYFYVTSPSLQIELTAKCVKNITIRH